MKLKNSNRTHIFRLRIDKRGQARVQMVSAYLFKYEKVGMEDDYGEKENS